MTWEPAQEERAFYFLQGYDTMACEYGEAFKKPMDFMTGEVIKDAPNMGSPNTTRPNGNGHIVLRPEADVMENTTITGRPMVPERIDQARVTDHYSGY